MKNYLLNLLGNVEVADLIAPHVTQITTTLLSEPACRFIKPIEIDYNFIEVENRYLFRTAGRIFIKEKGSLKGSPRASTCYEYNESKKTNPASFIEGTHFQFTIFSDTNQLISKLNEGPKIFVRNFIICSQAPDFLSYLVRPCHSLSKLIAPNPLGWKENDLMVGTLKLVPRLRIFYHILSRLVTLYHTLSTLSPRLERKPFSFGNFKISSQIPYSLSPLIMPCHSL